MTTSTNCVQLKAKQSQHSLCLMTHNRHYCILMHYANLSPVMPINSKLDIARKLHISPNLRRLLFRVSCIKEQAEVLPHQAFYSFCFATMVPF